MRVQSWQTTAAGIIGGLGAAALAISQASAEPIMLGPVSLGAAGAGAMALALAWGFKAARDDGVSSEGTKIVKPKKLPE